jgi:hypothetical protein
MFDLDRPWWVWLAFPVALVWRALVEVVRRRRAGPPSRLRSRCGRSGAPEGGDRTRLRWPTNGCSLRAAAGWSGCGGP